MRYNNQEDFIDIGKVSTVINEKIEQGQSVGIYSQGEINLNLKNMFSAPLINKAGFIYNFLITFL